MPRVAFTSLPPTLALLFLGRLQVPEATFVTDQNAAQEHQFPIDWKERAHESKKRFSFIEI